jgi:hypothetical protein
MNLSLRWLLNCLLSMRFSRLLRLSLPLGYLLFSGTILRAEDFTTSDGQVITATAFRRVGNNIMIKVTTPEGGVIETGYPVPRIAKVSFSEPIELSKASADVESANATEILALTSDFVAKQDDFKDLPGSWWFSMARLRLLALAAAGKDVDAASLAREIGSLKDADADSLSRGGSLFAPLAAGDTEAVVVGAKSLPRIDGDQGSVLAQLALGRALLLKKDYSGALKAFLTIKVFYPSATLLQPAALLGASDAYKGLKDEKRALKTLQDIQQSYPLSPQAPIAKKTEADLSKPLK